MRKTVFYNNLTVYYTPALHGGGMTFGREFVDVVQRKIGPVEHIYEYCAGPGFIGFSLLANGLCKKLTLTDINPAAVEDCKETIRKNSLEDVVNVYVSDCLDAIPEGEQWDLVVSNPPMIFTSSMEKYHSNITKYDPDFRIHKKFYRDIHLFLKPGGSVCFQENGNYHKADAFIPMIEENGLQIIEIFNAKKHSIPSVLLCLLRKHKLRKCRRQSPIYFMWSAFKRLTE